jgi:hypothetical protein
LATNGELTGELTGESAAKGEDPPNNDDRREAIDAVKDGRRNLK